MNTQTQTQAQPTTTSVSSSMSLGDQYIASLTPKEHQAYLIAKDHLGSLFNVTKTNGFLAWQKKQATK